MEPEVDQLTAVALLADPLRRRLYALAAARTTGVTRDDAAAELGMARSVAAFHLDKLVVAGLLQVEYRRHAGRGGPGAGRPAKWYRRAPSEVAVCVPERRYQLAAEVLAHAAEEAAGGVPVNDALRRAARGCGRRLGASAGGSGAGQPLDCLVEVLADNGYEPRREGNEVWLANCPFHALVAGHRQLVCGMNLDLLRGLAETVGLPPGSVRLDPKPGRCCVTLAA